MPALALDCPQRPTLVPAAAGLHRVRLDTRSRTRPTPAPRKADGSRLEDWGLGAVLGTGGASVVYAGTCPDTGAPVAVKVMRPEMLDRPAMRRLFQREALVPARIHHPAVPAVLAHGRADDGRPWMVMPRICGGELTALLRRLALDTDTLRHRVGLLQQVARAVGSAHRAGVVHADLKPGNVLVDEDDHAWVIDWGLARVRGSQAAAFAAGTVTGTLGWMAPEQARGEEAMLGPGADVWALGCMLWCLLHGAPPHASACPIRGLRRTVRARPQPAPPEELEPAAKALWRIAARCLQPDPADRFVDAAILADVLGRWMGRTARQGNRPVGTLRAPGEGFWAGSTVDALPQAC